MEKSENINELAAALAKFQGSLEQPKMNSTVKVSTRTGGSYNFKYADFATCKKAAQKALMENGLSVTQLVEEDNSVMSVLLHSSGQWIASKIRIPAKDGSDAQAIGSAITYAKRYGYCAILGIVADDDDDANIALGNQYTKSQNQPQQQKKAVQPKEKKVFEVSNLTNVAFFEWLAKLAETKKGDPTWTLEKFIKDNYIIQDETYNELDGQYKYFITNKTL